MPVNPRYDLVLDLKCYPDLASLPHDKEVDIVNVFRRPEAVPTLLDEVAAFVRRTGSTPVVWAQLGVSSSEAREKAGELNIPYIEERCIMVELERLAGRNR
jgi:predicted CoA-binding protein